MLYDAQLCKVTGLCTRVELYFKVEKHEIQVHGGMAYSRVRKESEISFLEQWVMRSLGCLFDCSLYVLFLLFTLLYRMS